MTRTVVNTSQVAHLFAHQSQEHARTSTGNFYFHGNTCWSYGSHYVAAVHHGDCVLINNHKYSVTTSAQLSELYHACSHLTVFTVSNPAAISKKEHRENFRDIEREYEREILRLSRARVHTSTDHAERLLDDANAYAERFKIGNRLQPIALENAKAVAEKRKAKDRAAYRRAERARKKAAEKRAAELAKQNRKYVESWRAGEYHYSLHYLPVMLRLTSDGKTVQTSHGAEFPAEHARRSISFVLSCFEQEKDWKRNGENIQLGHFQIDHIDGKTGLLRAGCHTVTRQEIERFAKLLESDVIAA